MGPWKSHFELVIPHRSPSQLADRARCQGGKRTSLGLIIRVRDQRIRARYNDLSRASTAPLLKGRLVQEPSGTRIVAKIQWTNLIAAPFALVLATLVFLVTAVSVISEGEQVVGALTLVGAIAFGALSVLTFRSEGIKRQYEERRLRDSLLATFTKKGHR